MDELMQSEPVQEAEAPVPADFSQAVPAEAPSEALSGPEEVPEREETAPAPQENTPTPATPRQSGPALVTVADIQFRSGSKIYFFNPGSLTLRPGDHVIIETSRGPEFGICAGGNHQVPKKDVVPPLRSVLRLANAADERTAEENRRREKRAYDICQQKIAEHKLNMQLVSAEYAFDGSKILFFFTADDRVDFRELVKNLASVFRTRIELRQIGVRDKAKMVGGLGICGRPFCCAQFLDDFQPVSIKMAKTQNLSLNPTKISGTCGRLMCCLKYEQEAYEDLLRTSPKQDSFVDTPDGRGTVVEVNLLRQCVKVRMEEQPETITWFPNGEICILRNGKAKKTDPPIPADLAPISGGGKRKKPVMAPEAPPMTLQPIRFRYRPDDIVEEPEEAPIPEDEPEEPQIASVYQPEDSAQPSRPQSRRKRRNAGKAQGSRPQNEQPREKAAQEKKESRPERRPMSKGDRKPEAAGEKLSGAGSQRRRRGGKPRPDAAGEKHPAPEKQPDRKAPQGDKPQGEPSPRKRRPNHRPRRDGNGGTPPAAPQNAQ